MHELSLCEGILQILEEQAELQGYRRVRCVHLEVGRFAMIELDALHFSFEVVTRGSLAEGARLEVVALPGRAWCLQCKAEVAIRQRYDPCPHCGDYRLLTEGGDELEIKELEVE